MTTIGNQLQQVHTRIEAACSAVGRPRHSVQLLAVSKTFGVEAVRQAATSGQRAFGENYVQEGVEKILALRADPAHDADGNAMALQWHCIGPVQSNKTRLVAEHFDAVQSLDRLKTAERLAAQRPLALAPLDVWLQVNIDGGAAKSGMAPDDALALALAVAAMPQLRLRGLMVIPEPAPNFVAARATYTGARALFDHIFSALDGAAPHFDTLSAGMSADLEAAIAGGSGMVRVGSALFGQR